MSHTAEAMRDLSGSPDRFGWEWDTYAEVLPDHEEQFRRWAVHVPPQAWQDKTFLDVGCGMGRNSLWPMSYGARAGVAADIDDRSLASAQRTLQQYPAMQVMRCSAYDLPFEDRFDIAFSIGVIHHLEFPERALARMARAVRPSGQVMIWVYGKENNRWLLSVLNPLRKALFSRLPIRVVHHLSLYPALLLWVLLRAGIRPIEYFRLLAGLNFAHLRSIVFDQMLPRIANYWSREEVMALMQGAGLKDVRLAWVNQMSWSAIGTKPEAGLSNAG